jgi:sugar lactone lactonase YvrE
MWTVLTMLAVVSVANPVARAQSDYSKPYDFFTLVGQRAGLTSVDGFGVMNPVAAAVDANGNIYVATGLQDTVRKVTPAGIPTPLVGAFEVAGSADGTGASALFNNPGGVAVDASGNLYVADTGNQTVRKVTPAGVVTTLAGSAGNAGSTDGTGTAATFNAPFGIGVDASGTVYVAEQINDTIRKITPSGVVTTLAGSPGHKGSTDGNGSDARFDRPSGLAVDGAGNIYVADFVNDTVRKITPSGVVTTIAGSPGKSGDVDGPAASARFNTPNSVGVDGAGNVFVDDTGNQLIREITSAGAVLTLGGSLGIYGGDDGTGVAALFANPLGIAADAAGNVYIADTNNAVLRKGMPTVAPLIQTPPLGESVAAGASATFSVVASGTSDLTYQWNFNGVPIAGATGASYTLAGVQPLDAGAYSVTLTDAGGTVTSTAAGLTVSSGAATARVINISTRAQVGTGGNILIPGFVIAGTGTETLLIRAIGPTLSQFSVSDPLELPSLTVKDAQGNTIASNTGWSNNPDTAEIVRVAQAVGAFALDPGTPDCALIVSLSAGAYTVQVSGLNGLTGVALAEVYEVASTGTRLINISTRAQVGTGSDIIIAGFVIGGSGTEQLLVRGDGPSLAQFNLTGLLALPSLGVFDGSGKLLSSNTGWGTNVDPVQITTVGKSVGAFALQAGDADSAEVISLSPGAYTLQVSGVNNGTGVALAEVYEASSH